MFFFFQAEDDIQDPLWSRGLGMCIRDSFKPVGITLGIRPVIAGTETVILQIHADVSAVTGFASTDPIGTPIVSTLTAVTSVHVPNCKSTVIGGLRTTT